jgi:hypothetical protein
MGLQMQLERFVEHSVWKGQSGQQQGAKLLAKLEARIDEMCERRNHVMRKTGDDRKPEIVQSKGQLLGKMSDLQLQ